MFLLIAGAHTYVPMCGLWMFIMSIAIPLMQVSQMAISCVTHNKLHEMCMLHTMRKCGPHKHITGLFQVVSCCHTCTNEVIIE